MPGMPGEFARLQTVLGSEEMQVSRALDLTVCCRSNDLIWGAYGANIVHFSVLQEYLAARLGAEVGILYQVSNNFHAYTSTVESVGTPTAGVDYDACPPAPLVTDPESWDVEVEGFVRDYESGRLDDLSLYHNSWFRDTARPIAVAHDQYREGAKNLALDTLGDRDQYPDISEDWRKACFDWIGRRV